MSRDTLWQNGGSERRMFSELDEKPRFKEASNKIRFATSSLAWNFNKRLLTPKFGTGGSLICGPSLVKDPVHRRKVSSKGFGRGTCGRQFASVRQRDCLRWFRRIAWWCGPSGRDELVDKHSHFGDKLGIKYCARSPPGVMPRQGINMNPGCM
jgi:hypothetical protein